MHGERWRKCVDFHGHSCPGLAIGFQAAMAARELLGIEGSEDEEVVCVTENDACGVDAIQVLTGCTLGKGNLIYRPAGKQAFSFFRRDDGEALRLVLKRREWPAEREERRKAMLGADAVELFSVQSPHYQLPERAQIFQTVPCEDCREGTAEPYVRLVEGRKLCTDCAQEYTRGW